MRRDTGWVITGIGFREARLQDARLARRVDGRWRPPSCSQTGMIAMPAVAPMMFRRNGMQVRFHRRLTRGRRGWRALGEQGASPSKRHANGRVRHQTDAAAQYLAYLRLHQGTPRSRPATGGTATAPSCILVTAWTPTAEAVAGGRYEVSGAASPSGRPDAARSCRLDDRAGPRLGSAIHNSSNFIIICWNRRRLRLPYRLMHTKRTA